MRLLLDTHVFLWFLKGDRRISKTVCHRIQSAEDVYVSSVSIWEAAIKIALGKLDVHIEALIEGIELSGFSELSITAYHAGQVAQLPDYHRDPFDRMLIAQATSEPLKLLTTDGMLKKYSSLVEII